MHPYRIQGLFSLPVQSAGIRGYIHVAPPAFALSLCLSLSLYLSVSLPLRALSLLYLAILLPSTSSRELT